MKLNLSNFALRGLLAILIHSLAIPPYSYAVLDPLNATSQNPANIKAQPPACKDICSLLVGKDGIKENKGTVFNQGDNFDGGASAEDFKTHALFGGEPGVGGGSSWASSGADQWCANHGFPTDVTVQPTATPTPVGKGSTCNVPVFEGETCKDNNNKALQCMLHGSQLESNCMAWYAGTHAMTLDYVVMALDLVATLACANACAAIAFSAGTAQTACTVTGVAASLAEITATLAQANDSVGQMLTSIGGAAGGTVAAGMGQNHQHYANKLSEEAAKQTDEGLKSTEQGLADKRESNSDNMACIAAGFFAVMAGIRIANIASQNMTKDEACKNVQKLWSNAASTVPGGSSTNPAQTVFNPATGQISQGGPGGGSGGNSGGNLNDGSGNNKCGTQPCPDASKATALTGAATDSGFLRNTGMDRSLGPAAQNLLDNGLQDLIRQGAGAAMGGALGGAGGELGAALSKLAQEAQNHAAELAGAVGATYSGGGGAGGGRGSDGANPFAALLGGGQGGPAAGAKFSEFGFRSPASDIWHTGTTMNLFQIVSGKIEQVSNRVRR